MTEFEDLVLLILERTRTTRMTASEIVQIVEPDPQRQFMLEMKVETALWNLARMHMVESGRRVNDEQEYWSTWRGAP